ncbi:hypothetical protein QFZ67_007697 [Streptomyces sp. V1I1]|nr:hypothetical protein [Streptomyces sp. V1I1]
MLSAFLFALRTGERTARLIRALALRLAYVAVYLAEGLDGVVGGRVTGEGKPMSVAHIGQATGSFCQTIRRVCAGSCAR